MKKGMFVLFFSLFPFLCNAQFIEKIKDKVEKLNPRVKYPAAVNIYAFGPIGLVGLTYDYFIIPSFAIEGGLGLQFGEPNLGLTFGGRYHLFAKSPLRLTPYFGIYNSFGPKDGGFEYYNLYIPVGINRIEKNQLNWSFEIAYQRNSNVGSWISGGIKFGPRFRIFNR